MGSKIQGAFYIKYLLFQFKNNFAKYTSLN